MKIVWNKSLYRKRPPAHCISIDFCREQFLFWYVVCKIMKHNWSVYGAPQVWKTPFTTITREKASQKETKFGDWMEIVTKYTIDLATLDYEWKLSKKLKTRFHVKIMTFCNYMTFLIGNCFVRWWLLIWRKYLINCFNTFFQPGDTMPSCEQQALARDSGVKNLCQTSTGDSARDVSSELASGLSSTSI